MSLRDQVKGSTQVVLRKPAPTFIVASSHFLNPPSSIEKKYYVVQVLRFVAALMVIILHSTFYTSERLDASSPIYFQGGNGVRLFFVISGFVMIISSESLKKLTWGWKVFAEKRIIRILPIYWILTTYKLAIVLFASFLVYHSNIDTAYVLKSYFFIPAKNIDGELSPLLGVGWTLNFEMFFNFLFAVALAFRINAVVFLSSIFIPLAVLSIFKTPNWPDISFYTNPIITDFLYGMIAAKLLINSKKIPGNLSIAFMVTGLLYLFLPKMTALYFPYKYDDFIAGIASFMVVYGAVCIEKKWRDKIPSWLVYLGGASYSLYLVHPLIAPLVPTVLNMLHIKWIWLSVLLSIITSVAAGTLFYRICEKPITQFLTRRVRRQKVAVAPVA